MKVDVMVVPWRYFSTLQGHNYHAVLSSALRAWKTFARNLPLLVIICLLKKIHHRDRFQSYTRRQKERNVVQNSFRMTEAT